MRHLLILVLRVALFAAGIILVYTSLSYETEEGKIQSRLEEWWVRVDDYRQQALSKHVAFLKTLASVASSILNRLFGPQLFSAQSIGVSISLSFVCIGVLSLVIGKLNPNPNLTVSASVWLIVTSGGYAIIPVFLQRIRTKIIRVGSIYLWFVVLVIKEAWGLTSFILLTFLIGLTDPKLRLGAAFILSLFFLIFIAEALFYLLVVLMRRTVRAISESNSPMKIMALSLLNIVPLVFPAMMIGAFFLPNSWGRAGIVLTIVFIFVGVFGLVINFPFLLSALVFLFLATTMFIHWLFWPAIARPLYKLQEMGVAKRPLLFRAIGFLLIGVAFGKPEWLWFLLSKF